MKRWALEYTMKDLDRSIYRLTHDVRDGNRIVLTGAGKTIVQQLRDTRKLIKVILDDE
jgi:hypothetical protein